jgi:predicted ATPase/DNA-binding CsgD family transcriptional regulator
MPPSVVVSWTAHIRIRHGIRCDDGPVSPPGAPDVSRREAQVLAAISGHLTNVEIAVRLHISVRTVESHVSSLLRKFGAADRRALARLAGTVVPATVTPSPRPEALPPPRVVGLPPRRTSFVGRAHERDGLLAGLVGSPLVTLVGPGGVGKTRLAVEVAAAAGSRFVAGAFVDLVPVRDGFVAQAVAAALGVGEAPDRPFEDAIAERLGAGPALLVLDNCEHVPDATATFVTRLLAASPATTVLATSRERLGVPGERAVPVGPLPLSSDAEALFADRARAADPTWAADPAAVARICARLDGMPLAIELAAPRGAALGTDGLLAALDDAMRALTGGRGRDERHRSLRDVIGWSHDLLDEEERVLFRRLAVFAGAFDVDAAVAVAPDLAGGVPEASLNFRRPGPTATPGGGLGVASDGGPEAVPAGGRLLAPGGGFGVASEGGPRAVPAGGNAEAPGGGPGAVEPPLPGGRGAVADLLGRLAGKSLIVSDGGRWRLLETIRAFARERLDAAGERDMATKLHLRWAATTATRLTAALSATPPGDGGAAVGAGHGGAAVGAGHGGAAMGPGHGGAAIVGDGREEWQAGFDAVADDLRAALAATPPGPDEVAHRLARGLARLAYARRFLQESQRHFRAAAERAPTPAEAAADLRTAAEAVFAIGHASQAYDLLCASAARARAAGDGGAAAIALARAVVTATRFPSGFPTPVPRDRLDGLLAEASSAASTGEAAASSGPGGSGDATACDGAGGSGGAAASGGAGGSGGAKASSGAGGSGEAIAFSGAGRSGEAIAPGGAGGAAASGGAGGSGGATASGDEGVAAHLAAARVWHTPPGTPAPDPAMAGVALAAARATGDPALISGALDALGTLAAQAGRLREAHRLSRERLDLLPLMDRRQPGYAAEILDLFHVAWLSAFAAGDLPAALATAEAIRRDDLLGVHPYRATSKLVPALVLTGRFDEALEHARSMWDGWERLGGPTAAWMSPGASAVALAHGLRGDRDGYALWRVRAIRATGVANPKLARYNASFAAFVEARVATQALAADRAAVPEAAAIVERCFGDFPVGWHETYARAAGAELAVVAGLPDAAERLAAAAPAGDENDWAAACLARTAGRPRGESAALAAAVEGWERIDAAFERACTLLLIPERADEGRAALSVYSGPTAPRSPG